MVVGCPQISLMYISTEDMESIKFVGTNNLHYADDSALIANTEDNLQRLLDRVVGQSMNIGLTVNIKKTVCMVIFKSKVNPACTVLIKDVKISSSCT